MHTVLYRYNLCKILTFNLIRNLFSVHRVFTISTFVITHPLAQETNFRTKPIWNICCCSICSQRQSKAYRKHILVATTSYNIKLRSSFVENLIHLLCVQSVFHLPHLQRHVESQRIFNVQFISL